MNRFDASLSLKGLASGANRKPTIILVWAPVAIVTWRTFGSQGFFLRRLLSLAAWNNPPQAAALYADLTALVLFGLASLGFIRFVLNETLASYGVAVGEWRVALKALVVLSPVMVALGAAASKNPEFLAQYPLYRGACASLPAFLLHAAAYLAYYLGFEAFFRGLVQFGLRESLGDWYAILVQTALSTLMHIGKPTGEIYGAVVGGIVFGVLAFRARSLLVVILLHFILGVSLDLFICIG